MNEVSRDVLRVAVLADEHQRGDLRAILEDEGMEIVLDGGLELPLPDTLRGAEVLLVDMDDARVDRQQVHGVLQQSPVPVLLNHGGVGEGEIWTRRLIGKLRTLARRAFPAARMDSARGGVRPELRVVDDAVTEPEDGPWLVVLGGSIGGPRALARFLAALPREVPVTLLVAQHISEQFQDLLVEQLDRCSDWPVALLGDEQALEAGQVWIVPADRAVEVDASLRVRLSDGGWDSLHRPDIDSLLERVCPELGRRCGVILFSGLGEDGSRGCSRVASHGGFVWTQSAESCAIPNLPDAVARVCSVEFSGSPEQLAEQLALRCQVASARIN